MLDGECLASRIGVVPFPRYGGAVTVTVTRLLESIRRLLDAQSDEEVYQATVEAADAVISADTCLLVTAEDDHLIEQASTAGELADVMSNVPMGKGFLGHTCHIDRSCVIDDLLDVRSTSATTSQSSPADPDQFRSLLCVPITDIGIFVAAARVPDVFSDEDLARIEQLVECTEAVIDSDHSPSTGDTELGQLEEIARVLSHDVTNPLSVARGHLELARETGDEQHLDRIKAAHDRIDDLVDDLVTLARTGEHIDELTAVDLGEMANTAWATVETEDVTLEIDETRSIKADRSRLCQLLENLFANGITHGGSDITVRVGCFDRGFYIEDDGRGFSDEERDRLFEWGHSSPGGGTGLGLSIVKQVVDAHGWNVRAVTSASGGARFEITDVERADETL